MKLSQSVPRIPPVDVPALRPCATSYQIRALPPSLMSAGWCSRQVFNLGEINGTQYQSKQPRPADLGAEETCLGSLDRRAVLWLFRPGVFRGYRDAGRQASRERRPDRG